MDAAWYRKIFDEAYLDRYLPLLTAERTEREVEEVISLLELPPSSRILDLCCGHGRHAIAFARRGYQVTGLDLSAPFLERARADAAEAGVELRWIKSDMREIPFADEFDAVLNLFTAFGYLEDQDEDMKVLHSASRALKPGGTLLLETLHRDSLLRRFAPATVQRFEDGMLALDEHQWDLLTGRISSLATTVYPDGRRIEYRYDLRLYTAAELSSMFQHAGLTNITAFGGLDQSPLTLESRRLVLTGRKP